MLGIGDKGCRWRYSQHMLVQHRGERIANSADNRLIGPDVLVESICCAEESIGLGHGHAFERQCAAAMCDGYRRWGNLVVIEPGINELERLWMWRHKFSDLLLRQVLTISVS